MDFIVFPAIDLRGGQVVRLAEGDPNRQTAYSSDPAAMACRWLSEGVSWLHVVNLDGAFGEGDSANQAAVQAILVEARRAGASLQLGGGMRSLDAIRKALDLGVGRVVLGTALVEQPEILEQALARWGAGHVAASLDHRDGLVQIRGWQQSSGLDVLDVGRSMAQAGLKWLISTDISRDGLFTGLNIQKTRQLAEETGLKVVASGGVSRAADVTAAREASLAGVIVGKALYEGSVRLSEVLC